MFEPVKELWPHLSSRRKKQILLLILLTIFASIFEIVSIGSVVPFLGVLLSPDKIFNNEDFSYALQFLEINSIDNLAPKITILFILSALFSGMSRFLLLYMQKFLGHGIGSDISISIFKRTLYQPYKVFMVRNSSKIISGISTKISVVTGSTILPIFQFMSSSFIIFSIVIVLIIVNPLVSIIVFLGFGSMYALMMLLSKNKLKKNSIRISKSSDLLIKAIQEGLGGIRDIIVNSTQEVYCKVYNDCDRPLRKAKANNEIIYGMPKFLIETIGIVAIAFIAFSFTKTDGGLAVQIPLLGAFAIGAQKLLPLLQQLYASISQIKGEKSSFRDVMELLNQPMPKNHNKPFSNIAFNSNIELKAIFFRYDNSSLNWTLNNVNIKVKKGEKIGLIGSTGSGKSTLIDLILGLLNPSQGHFLVDGVVIDANNSKSWQSKIAHVPQDIFLADASVKQNIAFGVNNINMERVKQAARNAEISDFIESLPLGYDTNIGERGVKFSGGQQQRLGIARALYKSADLIIFDEATSALDRKTEKEVMNSIDSLSKSVTIILVAHRISSLSNCDRIIQIENGSIKRIDTYKNIIKD